MIAFELKHVLNNSANTENHKLDFFSSVYNVATNQIKSKTIYNKKFT